MTFLVDTHEPFGPDGPPHPWTAIRPADVCVVRGPLPTGNVALAALPDGVVVKRKTVGDFLAGQVRETDRAARILARTERADATKAGPRVTSVSP